MKLARTTLALLLATLGFVAAQAAPPPELSIEELFGSPALTQLRFSPDGRYVAALQPWEKRQNLIVVDLQKMQKTQITSMKQNNVSDYLWAGDNRLFFFMDEDGKESFSMYAVDADGRNAEHVSSFYRFGLLGRIHGDARRFAITGSDPVDASAGKRVAKYTLSRWQDVYHLDLKTGRAKLHARNPGNFDSWVIDRAGVARLGVNFDIGVTTVYYRDDSKAAWDKIATFRDGEPYWRPIGFDGDNRTLYVACNFGRRTEAIFRYDTQNRQLGEMVHGDDTYDVNGIVYNDALNRVVGVNYQADRPTVVWFDKSFHDYQRALDRSFPDTLVRIAEASSDNSKLLVVSYSDRVSGEYYLFDSAKRSLEPLASIRPNLKPAHLAPMHPFSFKARDGLRLHGYLTLPVGREPKNLPTIVHPHGGPYGPRDNWGFNPEVQFYANRGFAVLQVNFRGSGGYGDFFERAGHNKWGLEMQDDLTDALKWSIAQGITDPKKVVISGASYGGYAAMAGLVYTPELYCAGINYVGVTDIMMLIDNPGFGTYDGRNGEWWRRTRIGDPYKDGERIKATSPANFADRIKVPLLMGYGLNDPRVEIAHGTKAVAKLKDGGRVEGRDFWFYTEKEEGHGFSKEENRIAFYRRVDEFLKSQVLAVNRTPEITIGPAEVLELPAKPKTE